MAARSELGNGRDFAPAYAWLRGQMSKRISGYRGGPPSRGGFDSVPVFAHIGQSKQEGETSVVAYAKEAPLTPQEYLARERRAATKSEYLDGVLRTMAGASAAHNRLTFDLARLPGNLLEGQPCEGFASDMRVRIASRNRYDYPDLVVVCGEPVFEDAEQDSLLNPTLVFEVLSDSTERFDRTVKFDDYRTLPSLICYILVAQDIPRIEWFTRQADDAWRYDVTQGLESDFSLPAVEGTLRLSDIYARIRFESVSDFQDIQGITTTEQD